MLTVHTSDSAVTAIRLSNTGAFSYLQVRPSRTPMRLGKSVSVRGDTFIHTHTHTPCNTGRCTGFVKSLDEMRKRAHHPPIGSNRVSFAFAFSRNTFVSVFSSPSTDRTVTPIWVRISGRRSARLPVGSDIIFLFFLFFSSSEIPSRSVLGRVVSRRWIYHADTGVRVTHRNTLILYVHIHTLATFSWHKRLRSNCAAIGVVKVS